MRPSALLVLVTLVVLCAAPAASAQTLIPPPLFGGGSSKPSQKPASPKCGSGVLLLCAADTVASGIGDAVGAGAGFAANAVLGGVVSWASDGAAWLLKTVGEQIDRSTRPALGSAWFGRRYAAMRSIALSLVIVFLLAAITQAAIRRDLGALGRAVLLALPLGVLLTFAAVTLAEMALAITDGLTAAALAGAGTDARDGLSGLATVLAPTAAAGPALPGLVLFLGALLTALLALLVWIELVLREAAIYVALAFLPITLAAMTWPRTVHWSRRLAEWLSALILAKFTIAASFGIAGSMLGEARGGSGGLSALLGGCAVLLVAALSPWVLLRMIPFAEQAAGSLQRSQLGGALASVPGATASMVVARQVMAKSFTPGVASGGSQKAPSAESQQPPKPPAPKPPARESHYER